MQRDYRADNIRFLLIFLVVFAHLLEHIAGETADCLYRLIYSFHMSAFVFLTGYFARFRPGKILLSLIWPYFLFQTLYKLFHGYVIQGAESVALTYTTPYWLLWYLMASIFYYLLIPMLQQKRIGERVAVLAGVTVVSLLAGLDETIGYYLALSRFFCYLPFFVAGYYAANQTQLRSKPMPGNTRLALLAVCLILIVLAEWYILSEAALFRRNVLYGSYGYEKENYSWVERLVLHGTGFAWITALMLAVPNRKFPVITRLGGNTFPIFLFHGFLLRLIGKAKIFQYSEGENLLLAMGIALGLLLLFGNPVSAWVCKWIFTGHALAAVTGKKEKTRA